MKSFISDRSFHEHNTKLSIKSYMIFGPCLVFFTCRNGSIRVFAVVELERYGVSNASLEKKDEK